MNDDEINDRRGGARPGAGRPKGVRNKVSRIAKENVRLAYDAIGGWRGMAAWAKANPGEFYTKIWARTLKPEMSADSIAPPSGVSIVFVNGVDPIPRTTIGEIDEVEPDETGDDSNNTT